MRRGSALMATGQAGSWWLAAAATLFAASAAVASPTPQGRQIDAAPALSTPPLRNAQATMPPPGGAKPDVAGGTVQRGSDGVIVPPPSIDPGMTIARPNPDAFPTPTVRPPGTPGSDPKIVPK